MGAELGDSWTQGGTFGVSGAFFASAQGLAPYTATQPVFTHRTRFLSPMPESNLMAQSVPLGRAYEIIEDGKPFGHYVIVRCLAYDMLGTLYLAQNKQTNARETLFVFPSLVAQDREFPDRFVAQTKKLCTLKHANLINFTQPAIIQNSYCLVGEAFEGLNIPDHLMVLTGSQLSTSENKQATNLPPGQVTPILEQVLAGLAFAHENKVMHLNLNPTKILRSSFGEVKIYGCHFLAILGQELFEMLVSAGIPPLKLDPNRSFMGTTDILSPEARLRKELEYRSDIYAIGVNTHWLLTGKKPTSPYQTPSQVLPGIEAGWDAFTLRCLQRKPEDRYASANAALADLRNIAQLTPIAQNQPLELLLGPETPAAPAPEKKKGSGSQSPLVKKNKPVKAPRHARKPLTLVQRLLFVGLPALVVVGIAAFVYVQVEVGDEGQTGDLAAFRVPEDKPFNLWLTLTPRNAMVTVGGIKFPVSDGELRLQMAKGDYTITVASTESPPKYRSKRINYSMQPEPDHRYVNLDPNWAIVDFSTAPGATITAQTDKGKTMELGVADANGTLHITQNLGDGTYSFTATKDQYASAQLDGQKLELTKTYHFDLKPTPEPANITLITEPPGATVRMGDVVLGVTPLTTTSIPVDTTVHLSLEKSGYQTAPRTIRVTPGINNTVDLGNLSARMADLNLDFKLAGHTPTATEERDAKIIINSQAYPASTKTVPNLLEGSYTVVFQHPDYKPEQKSITIVGGVASSAAADLKPLPARLVIKPDPVPTTPVAVYLNNNLMRPELDGSYLLPPNAPDKVRVEAKDFAGSVRDFKPGPNEALSWDVKMEVIAPPVASQGYKIPYLNLDLAWIPAGNYTMGSPSEEMERQASEGPQTKVTFPAGFWAGKFEVTQAQYQAVMGANPSHFGSGEANAGLLPVEQVSWLQAVQFTKKLTENERAAKRIPAGYEYRLPTEAEWEYFARAGTTTPFSFGDTANNTLGNFHGSYPRGMGAEIISQNLVNGTKPVGSYQPNAWGLYDVHGNVGEWVLDAYQSHLPGDAVTAPALATGDPSSRRLYRGGGWSDEASEARSDWRDSGGGLRPDTVSDHIGLRVVLAPVIAPAK
jgi:formylglycine-generating enzyme required for sulfatase activity/serine/threonine protein kinase